MNTILRNTSLTQKHFYHDIFEYIVIDTDYNFLSIQNSVLSKSAIEENFFHFGLSFNGF